MQFSQDFLQHPFIIRSVTPEGFQVNTEFYPYSIRLSCKQACHPAPIQTFEELTDVILSDLLAEQPDLLLIGTGSHSLFLPPALLAQCWQAKVGVECMTTAAAARTYNVLSHEGRRVSALLFKVSVETL